MDKALSVASHPTHISKTWSHTGGYVYVVINPTQRDILDEYTISSPTVVF